MTEWSDLPVEMRHEVAKNLNIIDRVSLKMCSKTDYRVINSLHKKVLIPLVVLSISNNWVSLIIYHGIEDYIMMKFAEEETSKKTLVTTRRSNSKLHTQQQSTMKPFEFAARTFEQLLMQKNIKIKTFHLEFPGYDKPYSDEFLFTQFRSYIKSPATLRIGVVLNESDWDMLFGMARIDRVSGLSVHYPWDACPSEFPFMATVYDSPDCYYWSLHADEPRFEAEWSSLSVEDGEEEGFEETTKFCLTHNNPIDRNPQHLFDSIPGSFDVLPNGSKVKKIVLPSRMNLLYFNLSTCGIYVYKTAIKNEKRAERMMRQKCGLEIICAKHADPFDYWYIKDFKRRQKDGDFWMEARNRPVRPRTARRRLVDIIEHETARSPSFRELEDSIRVIQSLYRQPSVALYPRNESYEPLRTARTFSERSEYTCSDISEIQEPLLGSEKVSKDEKVVERVVEQMKSQKTLKMEQKEQKRQMKEESVQTEESKESEKVEKKEEKEKKRGKIRSLLCCF